MKRAALFFSSFLFSLSCAFAQSPSGYVLSKTDISSASSNPQTITYQWTASNNTSAGGNFFILENVPGNETLQSIVMEASLSSALPISPSLPSAAPGPVTLGPFYMASDSSVTFQVTETLQGSSSTVSSETFSLVSQIQLAGNGGPSPAGSGRGLIQSLAAVHNFSRGGQPVGFSLSLNAPARVTLALFTLTGERVYDFQIQGTSGVNQLSWNIENNAHQAVTSGLYIYVLRVFGNGTEETKVGKVVVLK